MFQHALVTIDILGLCVLLGGGVYESVVMNPNYRSNLPQSLDYIRLFFKVRTPASLFRIASPVTMLFLLVTVIVFWGSLPARWWFVTAFGALILTDSITFGFHYPRNKVLFIDPLSTDIGMLQRLAREWAKGNLVRIFLMVIAVVSVLSGLIALS
jgi:uncharacterized membrane protein